MDELYICPHCGIQYALNDLEDNDDGTCIYCGCPLESSCGDSYSYLQSLGQEELNIMIQALKQYPMDELWHNIETEKDWKKRIKERKLFFEALKILNKKFELREE
jgi:uncharacterized paraquat-inducible protein A